MNTTTFTQKRVRLFLRGYLRLNGVLVDNWPRTWTPLPPCDLDEYARVLPARWVD